MKVFERNYKARKGTTFSEEILLSDIYVTLEAGETYTVTGGMILNSGSEGYVITGVLSADNTILTITMSPAVTGVITTLGNYNFAIDITLGGVVQTILEGTILVKDDFSTVS